MSSRTPKASPREDENVGPKHPSARHHGKSGEKKDDLSTFEKSKEAFLNKLWRIIPRGWRIPVAAVILIGGGLAATYSTWYPALDGWLHPPANRILVGGTVFSQAGQPCANAEVQLLNKDGAVISVSTTDINGSVSFNISDQDKIATLRCTGPSKTVVTLPFDSAAAAGKSFRVLLDQSRIEYL
jgi:hypothetical protein